MRTTWAAVALVVAVAAGSVGWAAAFKPGDMAVVKTDNAEVQQGGTLIAPAAMGTRITLHYVHAQGGFALVYIKLRGKAVKAYVRIKDLEPPTRKETTPKSTGLRPLDKIVVEATSAKLMKGKTVLGRVPKGTVLTVIKVTGDWLAVKPRIGGKELYGWLHTRDVDYAPSSADDGDDETDNDDAKDKKTDGGKSKDGKDDDWMK